MSLQPHPVAPVPEETARVARAAFPKGNLYLRMRDELGSLYEDELFSPCFPRRGQPAEAPWRLALVLVMQFAEGLSDRQAAEAVRGRIDWKYALSLELTDPGFDFSVLSEFRDRLLDGTLEQQLLDVLLAGFQERGLLKARGHQRTDSTHVLAAVRVLNRLELIGETLRAALNRLATVVPDWLRGQVSADWFDRYGPRVEEYRLPKGRATRQAYAEQIGRDGDCLLQAIYAATAPAELRQEPAVETLRQVWVHQFYQQDGEVRLRAAADLPPTALRSDSPYDPQARYSRKRDTGWTGYQVHLTENCDPDAPHFVTHIDTTPAPLPDVTMTAPIHAALAAKGLLPRLHLVDAGYVDADLLVSSQRDHQVEVVGPVRPDVSWQAHAAQGYDITRFTVDWATRTATCPEGQTSVKWCPAQDAWGNAVVHVEFAQKACQRCACRSLCTRAKTEPRALTLRPQAEHEALQAARQRQTTSEWKQQYEQRAGVEGSLSQGVRAFGLRQSRYLGLAKTRLQHLLTAVAMNLVRWDAWCRGIPLAKTRTPRFAALRSCAA
jgi:transposase